MLLRTELHFAKKYIYSDETIYYKQKKLYNDLKEQIPNDDRYYKLEPIPNATILINEKITSLKYFFEKDGSLLDKINFDGIWKED